MIRHIFTKIERRKEEKKREKVSVIAIVTPIPSVLVH
jgi:hypothetical protein